MGLPYIGQFILPSATKTDSASLLVTNAYTGSMVCSFLVWVYAFVAFIPNSLAIWTNANPSTQIIVIDTVVLFLALLITVLNENPVAAVQAILMGPLVGPGAALSYALLRQERYTMPLRGTKEA